MLRKVKTSVYCDIALMVSLVIQMTFKGYARSSTMSLSGRMHVTSCYCSIIEMYVFLHYFCDFSKLLGGEFQILYFLIVFYTAAELTQSI